MGWVTEYLLSITAAAVICVTVKFVVGEKSNAGKVISVITGVFMLIAVLNPVVNGSLKDLPDYFEEFYIPGDEIVSQAAERTNEEMKTIIKERAEAYILEEAERMSLNISVVVDVSDASPPVPESASISGSISPYKREQLSEFISGDLGILRENLQWN